MTHPALTNAAGKVANFMVDGGEVDRAAAIDPATAAAIITILVSLGKTCAEYLANRRKTQNPGLIARVRLRRYVSNNLGRAEYRKLGTGITNGLLQLGRESTAEEIDELVLAAQAS
jgi:hypothetical protein